MGKKIGITCSVIFGAAMLLATGYLIGTWESPVPGPVAVPPAPVVVAAPETVYVPALAGKITSMSIRCEYHEIQVVIENGAFLTIVDIEFDEVAGLAERAEELRQFCMDALKVKGEQ